MAQDLQFDPATEQKIADIQQRLKVSREKALQLAVATLHAQCGDFEEWLDDSDAAPDTGC